MELHRTDLRMSSAINRSKAEWNVWTGWPRLAPKATSTWFTTGSVPTKVRNKRRQFVDEQTTDLRKSDTDGLEYLLAWRQYWFVRSPTNTVKPHCDRNTRSHRQSHGFTDRTMLQQNILRNRQQFMLDGVGVRHNTPGVPSAGTGEVNQRCRAQSPSTRFCG